MFGSYGRGDAGVGSDLDLVLVDGAATGPQQQRLRLASAGVPPEAFPGRTLASAERLPLARCLGQPA